MSSRFPCLISEVGRFSTPPQGAEGQWVGQEGGESAVLNMRHVKFWGMVRLSACNS